MLIPAPLAFHRPGEKVAISDMFKFQRNLHPSSRIFAPTVLSFGGCVLKTQGRGMDHHCMYFKRLSNRDAAWPPRNYPSAGGCTAMPVGSLQRVCCDIRLQVCKVWFQLKHRIPTNECYESSPGRCRRSVTVCPLPLALVASLIKLQMALCRTVLIDSPVCPLVAFRRMALLSRQQLTHPPKYSKCIVSAPVTNVRLMCTICNYC